jgi:hypothetical protein
MTSADIVAWYRATTDPDIQVWLRETHPKLKLEFDAVDRIAEKQQRIAAKEAARAR